MTISEMICRLQAAKCEHGDLEVAIPAEGMVWSGAMYVMPKSLKPNESLELKLAEKGCGELYICVF